ncbi:MAG: fasciclin domain-containing protein [Phycisphaerales bacterium]
MIRQSTLTFTAAIATASVTGFALASLDHHEPKNIVETAVAAGSFETLATALTEAGLVDALQGKGPFTVFAPTDEAFAKLPAGTVETLLKPQNRDQLKAILTYHVVPGEFKAKKVVDMNNAETLNGQRVDIKTSNGKVMIDNATVVKTDIQCSNGVIHVIDSVILPSTDSIVGTAQSAGSFNTLLTAAKAAGLAETLDKKGPFTVLAPTDDAFAKLPKDTLNALLKPENKDALKQVLLLHVIDGRVFSDKAFEVKEAETLEGDSVKFSKRDGKPYVEEAMIVKTDIDASNGVIHVIDTVLVPDDLELATAEEITPREVIAAAINRGAPLFNHGQEEACAAIYEVTAMSLLAMPASEMCTQSRRELRSALDRIERQHDASDRAWTLRRALDEVYSNLGNEMRMRMTTDA